MTTPSIIAPAAARQRIEPQALKEKFNQDGYVILRAAIPPEAIAAARNELGHLVDEAADKLVALGRIQDRMEGEPFETRLYKLYANNLDLAPKRFREELHRPGFFSMFFNPVALNLAEELVGPEIRLYPNYTVRPKFPEWEGTQVLWHQDGGYTVKQAVPEEEAQNSKAQVGALKMVNLWASLVPATVENGCMQFIPGTHRLGVVPHVQRTHYLEIAEEVLKPHLDQAVNIEMEPGDIVLFHNLLFHQGQPNRSRVIRWSIDWRYQDARQATERKANGHIARSRSHPEKAVRSPEEWARLSFS